MFEKSYTRALGNFKKSNENTLHITALFIRKEFNSIPSFKKSNQWHVREQAPGTEDLFGGC